MSWRWEILTDQWMTNGLRFATKEEAEASVFDLTKGFYETRVTETDDPVNYRWVDGKAVPLNPNCESCGVELKSDPPHDEDRVHRLVPWAQREEEAPAQRELDF